jgi:phage baseplate assembly protein W
MDYTYSDISLSFKKHPFTRDILVKYDVDAVKQALNMIFLTNNYEKLFDPNFGVGIRNSLFELSNPITKISLKKKIQHQLSYYEQRVVIDDIVLSDDTDSYALSVDFYFHVIDNPSMVEKLSLQIERVR